MLDYNKMEKRPGKAWTFLKRYRNRVKVVGIWR
jgi:hypothetical protein